MKIAIDVIFIFNLVGHSKTVWQIKIIMHTVNCFNVINLAHTELILTVWVNHLKVTKHFRKYTVHCECHLKRKAMKMGISRLFCCGVNMLKGHISVR